MSTEPNDPNPPLADARWFRAPSRRERALAAGLFGAFGVFFVLLFFLNSGWWFRWILLILGIFSIMSAARHLRAARRDGA